MKDGSGRKAGAPHPRRGPGQQRWTPYSNGPSIFDCRRDTETNLRTGAPVSSLHSNLKTGRSGTRSARTTMYSALPMQGTAARPGKAVKRRARRDYVRARLAGIIQADLSTFGGQKYRRHGTGHGRTYRLRGSVTPRERVLFTGTNKDHAPTKAGR